jgi:hypothetical protein
MLPWLVLGSTIFAKFPNDADYIVKWLAQREQHPEVKSHALVLGGYQGIGKDTLLEPAKQAVGGILSKCLRNKYWVASMGF